MPQAVLHGESPRQRVRIPNVGGDDGRDDGPSAAPMILMYARVGRQRKAEGKPFAATGGFAAGYFLAWTGFSLGAIFVQWVIERTALLDSQMASASKIALYDPAQPSLVGDALTVARVLRATRSRLANCLLRFTGGSRKASTRSI